MITEIRNRLAAIEHELTACGTHYTDSSEVFKAKVARRTELKSIQNELREVLKRELNK